ncbi:MAG: hypothetical protein KDD35_07870, partial [Bdellovibrionales bacterium]|nr:hypothetical protein [Bdellovibrionales bacterium]
MESSMEAEQEETSPSNESRVLPHALWLIGAEGKTVQPRADVNWSLGKSVHRRATTILVGTQEQFNRISAELDFEMQFFSLQDHFEVEYLEPPSDDTKVKLIQSLFNLPEIQNLKFHFAIKGESLEARSQMQLIHHFVNRVDHIAYDLRMDRTTAFVKSFIVLKNSLIEDSELRRSRRIDENVVDRLFTKVFPMALNIDILEPSDPLRKVQKVDEAVRRLDQLGYRGSSDLKRRFLETYLSQTRPVDTSRPIPNSQLLFGGTGSGKTELILKFFEMLELKEYVSNKPSNEEADYLFIKVGDLTEKEANEPGKMSVERMVIDIYDFLSQPKGARGHLVFDDFHKAVSVQVRKRLFQVVQSLFDAKAGMITVRSKKGERVREIPVQNLNLYMTLNPTTNEARRKEYLDSNKYYSDADRLKREVLAALSDKDFDPEESVLARWADIINMKHFPRSAKVPELAAKVRETTRTSSGRIVLVDPEVIDLLVEKFPGANARQLLAPATAALTYVPSTAAESRLYLVTKKDWQFNFVENQGDPLDGIGVIQGQVNQSQLQSAVRQITQIDPINIKDMRSFVDFMAFLMREFRLQLFNGLVLEANMSDLLTLNIVGQTKVIRNSFIIGLADHIVGQLALPKGEIIVQPEQLGFFTRDESEELYELLASYRKDTKSYFPLSFHHKGYSEFGNLDEFLK